MKLLKFLVAFIFSMVIWYLISYNNNNNFSYNSIAIGALLSAITGIITCSVFTSRPLWLFNLRRIYFLIFYIPMLIYGSIKRGLIMSYHILKDDYKGNSIIKIQTEIKSKYGILLLSSAISGSPGTLVLDIEDEDEDKKNLYVHCVNIEEDKIDDAKEMIKEEHELWIRRISEK
ncbi:MAG: Na+/H+ antiporter subunit E [Oscillospiraceae bacterium]|nr:Na+/H+ antiporter subunit E [Oscillospiraceae bacterium]